MGTKQFAQVQKVALRALLFIECVGRAGHATGRAPFGDEVLRGHGMGGESAEVQVGREGCKVASSPRHFLSWYSASSASRGLSASGLMAASAASTGLAPGPQAPRAGGEQIHLHIISPARSSSAARVAGVVQHGRWHARQLGHLDAVAAAGRAGLDFVQKTMSLPALGRAHMHVDGMPRLAGSSVSSK